MEPLSLPPEGPLWNGAPSQVIDLGAFIGWGLLLWRVTSLFLRAGEALREQIRGAVQACRLAKRVREIDVDA